MNNPMESDSWNRMSSRGSGPVIQPSRGLFFGLIFLVCVGCSESPSTAVSGMNSLDVEGPLGIVREGGPWLVRVGIPVKMSSSSFTLSWKSYLPVESNAGEEMGGETQGGEEEGGRLIHEEGEVALLLSGRPDILFGLIPEIPRLHTIQYQLELLDQPVSEPFRFRWETQDGSPSDPPTSCEVSLSSPDPKLPITSDRDEAPWAGKQVSFKVEVFESPPGDDLYTSQGVIGLVLLDWLTVNSDVRLGDEAVLVLSDGQAFSTPMTVPSGVQKLRIRSFTARGARCQAIIELTSL